MPRKTAEEIEEERAELEAQRELEQARAARAARQRATVKPSQSYEGQMRYWEDYAARWGMADAIKRADEAVAGGFLSRDFGESAEAFYARSPVQRANRDWLKSARGR